VYCYFFLNREFFILENSRIIAHGAIIAQRARKVTRRNQEKALVIIPQTQEREEEGGI
jgi:hypothetical protein